MSHCVQLIFSIYLLALSRSKNSFFMENSPRKIQFCSLNWILGWRGIIKIDPRSFWEIGKFHELSLVAEECIEREQYSFWRPQVKQPQKLTSLSLCFLQKLNTLNQQRLLKTFNCQLKHLTMCVHSQILLFVVVNCLTSTYSTS